MATAWASVSTSVEGQAGFQALRRATGRTPPTSSKNDQRKLQRLSEDTQEPPHGCPDWPHGRQEGFPVSDHLRHQHFLTTGRDSLILPRVGTSKVCPLHADAHALGAHKEGVTPTLGSHRSVTNSNKRQRSPAGITSYKNVWKQRPAALLVTSDTAHGWATLDLQLDASTHSQHTLFQKSWLVSNWTQTQGSRPQGNLSSHGGSIFKSPGNQCIFCLEKEWVQEL